MYPQATNEMGETGVRGYPLEGAAIPAEMLKCSRWWSRRSLTKDLARSPADCKTAPKWHNISCVLLSSRCYFLTL